MSIVKLSHIKKLFGGSALTRAEQKQLAKEVMLMTLALPTHGCMRKRLSSDTCTSALANSRPRIALKP